MRRKIKKSIYALCACAGFLSAGLTPWHSEAAEEQIYQAAELVFGNAVAEEQLSAEKFSDIDKNSWYYSYADLLVKNGLIKGISDSEYSPGGTFTAAECSAVITRYLGLEQYASERQKELINSGKTGSNQWYSGYMQTLYDTGIITEGSFGISISDGMVVISEPERCTSPIERYQFASLITKSFDTNTELVSAKSIYPEVCNNGNNFITGGKYDDTVSMYESEIADFDEIPETSRNDVLKAYYNGIFNGDEYGNFNPYSLLTRAEMSKVIAVIIEPALRIRTEYRSLSDLCRIPESEYITDGWGEKTLDRNYGKRILEEAAGRIGIDAKGSSVDVSYTPGNAPEGYFIDVRFYENISSKYTEIERTDISATEFSFVTGTSSIRVMLMLRNSRDAKIEGVLRADISADGSVVYSDLFKPVLQ